ncbi:MAG TPA: hypothetical protein VFK19_10990 [Sphingomicrobium sp.]|nr:hypothetical protein [Sphingomicrobium sp.]
MSGRYQHSIPRAVLREFQIAGVRGEQVHVYRRDSDFPQAIGRASAERDFFSSPHPDGAPTLDDDMTDFENGPFNRDWQLLITRPAGAIDAALAARVINHLVGRTHHLRGVIKSGASAMGELVQQVFGNGEFLRGKFAMDQPRPTAAFKEMMLEQLKDSSLSAIGIPPAALVGLCHIFLRENGENIAGTVSSAASKIADKFIGSAATVARDAHVKGLTQSLSPAARFDYLSALEWHIVEGNDAPFILPDYVCLGFDQDGRAGSLFDIGGEELAGAYMPLSPSRMLVGRKGEGAFDLSRFNDVAAPFCFTMFVSNQSSDALEGLATTIGSSALTRIEEGLAEAASEIRADIDRPGDIAAAVSDFRPADIDRPSATLRSDWLEKERAERLASLLARLLAISSDRFDLRRLFDTPSDYAVAVKEATGMDVVGDSEGLGGDAFNVFFEDGAVHMLLHPRTIELLLSDDIPTMTEGISTIMPQLAHIGASTLLQRVFDGQERVGEAHDQMMIAAAVHCWIAYIVGLNSNFSGAGAQQSVEWLPQALAEMPEKLKALKARFSSQELADDLLNAAILHVAAVLATAGEAAAAAITGSGNLASLYPRLSELNLIRWFELLRSDLAHIWVPGDPYPPSEAFLVLDRHLERLLAMGGIFLWEQDGRANYWILDWLAQPATA